jgi:hypothetical protein
MKERKIERKKERKTERKTERKKERKKVGEKPGLVVRAEGSRPRGRGFESRRILDGCKRC